MSEAIFDSFFCGFICYLFSSASFLSSTLNFIGFCEFNENEVINFVPFGHADADAEGCKSDREMEGY